MRVKRITPQEEVELRIAEAKRRALQRELGIEDSEAPLEFLDINNTSMTPARTKSQHAEIWGYDGGADSAFKKGKPLANVWNAANPKVKARALPLDRVFTIVQEYRQLKAARQKAKNPKAICCRVPQNPAELLDMYESPSDWE